MNLDCDRKFEGGNESVLDDKDPAKKPVPIQPEEQLSVRPSSEHPSGQAPIDQNEVENQ